VQGGCGKAQRWGRYFRSEFLKRNPLVLRVHGGEVTLLNLTVHLV